MAKARDSQRSDLCKLLASLQTLAFAALPASAEALAKDARWRTLSMDGADNIILGHPCPPAH